MEDLFAHVNKKNNNSLNIFLDDRIPDRVVGDSMRLTQILFNLVGNACKYTQQGEIDVRAHLLPLETPDWCRVLFSVSDTGQGTTVYVSLPFRVPESSNQSSNVIGERKRSVKAVGLRILLVDDDQTTQLHIRRLLEKQGSMVHVVDDGQKALSVLGENEFDCILMDVQMPVLDGVEATKQIRNSDASYKDIPIIALTSYALTGDREKFLQAGMNDYIAKPVDKDELMEVVEMNVSNLL